MGTGRIAGDGIASNRNAGTVFRYFATRLRVRVPARRGSLLARLPVFWLARTFRGWSVAGFPGGLHSCPSSGISRLAASAKYDYDRFFGQHHEHRETSLGALSLRDSVND